jgi:hypothetical protein
MRLERFIPDRTQGCRLPGKSNIDKQSGDSGRAVRQFQLPHRIRRMESDNEQAVDGVQSFLNHCF